MIIPSTVYIIRVKVGDSVRSPIAVSATSVEEAIKEVQLAVANEESYKGEAIVPMATSVVDLSRF